MKKSSRKFFALLALFLAGAGGIAFAAVRIFVISKSDETPARDDEISRVSVALSRALPNEPDIFGNARPSREKTSAPARENFVFDGAMLVPVKNAQDSDDDDAPIFLQNGDLFDLYGGGREYLPEDASGDNTRDHRLWIDARVPVNLSSRLKLYGVSTFTLGDAAENASSIADYARYYGIGGGFGLSFKITDSIELNLDLRRTRSLENSDPAQETKTDSAGISLKIEL